MNQVYIIAEVGQNHDGSLGMAHAFIDAITNSGADAVKFQCHIADSESSLEDKFRTSFSYVDRTRYDYWKRMEFSYEQWSGLKTHAEKSGLEFLCTPFSIEAVELLEQLKIEKWKIGSGEVTLLPLIEKIAETNKPVFISTGLSTLNEINEALKIFKKHGNKVTIFQCTTHYPVLPENVGLNNIAELHHQFQCPVGFSDHSGTIYPSLAAVTLGAVAIEVHITFSKKMFGPDVTSSITIEDLVQMCQGIRYIEKVMRYPVDKDLIACKLSDTKKLFERSVYARESIQKKSVIRDDQIILLKPGGGFRQIDEVAGKVAAKDIHKGHRLSGEDLK